MEEEWQPSLVAMCCAWQAANHRRCRRCARSCIRRDGSNRRRPPQGGTDDGAHWSRRMTSQGDSVELALLQIKKTTRKGLLRQISDRFCVRAAPLIGTARTMLWRREYPLSQRTSKGLALRVRVLDVLLGLLIGLLGLGLGISVRIQRLNRSAQGHSLVARGCAFGAGI